MISLSRNFISGLPLGRQDEGQALPLVLVLLALIAITTFSVAMNLKSHMDSLSMREYKTFAEAEEHFKIQAAANGIVLNNQRLKSELFSLLQLTDSALSRGFRISASALLWEDELPIPRPYDIFKDLNSEIIRVGVTAQRLLGGSRGFQPDLEATGQWKAHALTMRQSLCRLSCLKPASENLSGTHCTHAFVWDDECSFTASQAPLIPHSKKTVPLSSVFSESFLDAHGFVYIEPRNLNDTRLREPRTEFSSGIAHPALCEMHPNKFSLPCIAEQMTAKKFRWLPENLAFHAQWSLTFEKKEH